MRMGLVSPLARANGIVPRDAEHVDAVTYMYNDGSSTAQGMPTRGMDASFAETAPWEAGPG